MVVDIFSYNGEVEILEIRLNILNENVDQFIICEAPTTFSGNPKPLYYERDKERFKKFKKKIKYFVIDENDEALWQMAGSSPNTIGAEHWKREFVQKESIKKALTHLKDDDVCFIGDVDEIWDPSVVGAFMNLPVVKLKLAVYPYYLNNLSNEDFWGTIMCPYFVVKDACLNHLRSNGNYYKTIPDCGWHFTSQGGLDEVRRKLNDSYTQESYNTNDVQERLESRFGERDYIGRNFVFRVDESHLPKQLIENKLRYPTLWKKQ